MRDVSGVASLPSHLLVRFFPQTASADGVLDSCKETDFVTT